MDFCLILSELQVFRNYLSKYRPIQMFSYKCSTGFERLEYVLGSNHLEPERKLMGCYENIGKFEIDYICFGTNAITEFLFTYLNSISR